MQWSRSELVNLPLLRLLLGRARGRGGRPSAAVPNVTIYRISSVVPALDTEFLAAVSNSFGHIIGAQLMGNETKERNFSGILKYGDGAFPQAGQVFLPQLRAVRPPRGGWGPASTQLPGGCQVRIPTPQARCPGCP